MQSLFEEFFKKVYGVSKGNTNSIMLIFLIRTSIYMFFIGGVALIVYLIFTGDHLTLFILIGLIFIGEMAHLVRKVIERNARNKAPKDASMEHAGDMLKIEKSKNKNLLKDSKPKNKSLLSKNKRSLRNKKP
jgi:hypothetical protein